MKKVKVYFVVLDGAADRAIRQFNGKTPLEVAVTPNLDQLASKGSLSYITILSEGLVPESDSGAMALLGYSPDLYYCGRGALEGLGLDIVSQYRYSASFRINFASYDKENGLLERRTARDLSDFELQFLGKELQKNIKLPIKFDMTVFGRYRGIISFLSNEIALSGNVSNTDPGFEREGYFGVPVSNYDPIPQTCRPLEKTSAAYITAKLVNLFSHYAACLLENHEINRERKQNGKLPANYILFRDGGSVYMNLPSFFHKYGMNLKMYGQLPAERGLAKLIQADFFYTQAFELQLDAEYLLNIADVMSSDGADISFIHLKGPDEPGHDHNPIKKKEAIEKIDQYFFKELLCRKKTDDIVVVTCDHATPCELGIHSADRVPLLFSGKYWRGNLNYRFTERCAKEGTCMVETADSILDYLKHYIK